MMSIKTDAGPVSASEITLQNLNIERSRSPSSFWRLQHNHCVFYR